MKCENCEKERFIISSGGICPTWAMTHALNNGLCLKCAMIEVNKLRK